MNYTKGEWKVLPKEKFGGGYLGYPITDSKGECNIAIIPTHYCSPEANANLIAASPDMYEALEAQHEAIDILFSMLIERDKAFFPSKSGRPWEAMIQGNKALVKANG